MELGLACPVCGSLNPLRAALCDRCNAVIAPRIVLSGPTPSAAAIGASRSTASALLTATSSQVRPSTNAGRLMGTMQLPTVQTQPPRSPPATVVAQQSPLTAPPIASQPASPLAPRFNAATGLPEGPAGQAKPAAKTMFFGALQQQAVVPRLVVIKGEGGDGVTYHLSATNHTVGRSTGDIRFSEDLFLNPEHARFTVERGRLFVKDMGSVNGVFVRIKQPVPLEHGDHFLVGEQLLRLDCEAFSSGEPDHAGTYSYSSPRPEGLFRVCQLLAGGGEGRIVSAQGAALTMGREGNTLNFPQDRFISGRHARLDAASDSPHVILTDTGSRNGTFVRTKGALELFHGDYLFVGQQLLRVEIS